MADEVTTQQAAPTAPAPKPVAAEPSQQATAPAPEPATQVPEPTANAEGHTDAGAGSEPTELNAAIEQYFTGEYERAKASESKAEHTEGLQSGGVDGDTKTDTAQAATPNTEQPQQEQQQQPSEESRESNNSPVQFNRGQYLRQVEEAIRREATQQITAEIDKQQKIIKARPKHLLDQKLFEEKGIKRYIDPTTKEAFPDFQSAKNWCDMRNAEFAEDMQEAIDARSKQIRTQATPGVQLNVFLNEVWPTLNKAEQETLDAMASPYAKYTVDQRTGMRSESPYAFDCDLFQMAELAKLKTKADLYESMQAQPQATSAATPAPVETPALDAKTSNNVNVEQDVKVEDLKDLGQALKYYEEHPELKRRF